VNISDDGWFGPTVAARQHLAHAIFRSVENNREMLRVTNSGITARIRPDGNLQDVSELFEITTRKWKIDLSADRPMTVYTRYGDFLAIACVIGTVAALVVSFLNTTPREKWEKKIAACKPSDK
jgi:apolipoprotein N-acyltransferase